MRFAEIFEDHEMVSKWELSVPFFNNVEVMSEDLTQGKSIAFPELEFRIDTPGEPVDWTFSEMDVPVVSQRVANALLEILPAEDIQLIPVSIVPTAKGGKHFAVNITCLRSCLNENRSEIIQWKPKDTGYTLGCFRMVGKKVIDSDLTKGAQLFRIPEWPVSVIASSYVQSVLEGIQCTGIEFDPLDTI